MEEDRSSEMWALKRLDKSTALLAPAVGDKPCCLEFPAKCPERIFMQQMNL
jgi:hypothetical protein